MKDEKSLKVNSKELIELLVDYLNDKKYRKANPLPSFSVKEALFVCDLIFHKPYKDLPFALFDFLTERYLDGEPLTNGPTIRRLIFMKNMLKIRKYKGAAIAAGYSPKGAKQEGYRVLKWIGSENTRRRNNGKPLLWGY